MLSARQTNLEFTQTLEREKYCVRHRNILELAKQDRLRNVLIIEDDVSFRAAAPSFEQSLIKQLELEDWDMVYFGYLSPPGRCLVRAIGAMAKGYYRYALLRREWKIHRPPA